ncbi:MAG: hypothetical protein IIC73_00060 [Armatimonadetes bacterium]|nr:hypothetical protein [Armatimonadota bacterium]
MVVKFTKSDLKRGSNALAQFVCGEIRSAEDARDGLKDRWAQNEQVYRNDPDVAGVQLYDNFEPRTVPVLSPRINRIVNVTMSAVTSPSPWVQAIPDDGNQSRAGDLESGIQTLMERSGFARTLRRALTTAALTGVSIVRFRVTAEGFQLDNIHPNDFIVAPTFNLPLEEAHLAGHRFYIPLWKLEDRVRSGTYSLIDRDENLAKFGGANPDDDPSGRDPVYDRSSATVDSTDQSNDLVELFEVLARLSVDGARRWYRIVVAPSAQRLLSVEEYAYVRPWYFDLRFHDEEGKWWPASSVAQNIVGLCLLQNDMLNLLVAGSMATAANPVVISGGSLGKKLQSITLGGLIETPYDVKVQEIPINFDPGAMPQIIESLDDHIDAQTGITRLSFGQEFLAQQTATAVAALIESTRQNEGSYTSFVSDFIEQAWAFVQYLARVHAGVLREAYGSALPDRFFESLRSPVRWRVAGRESGSAPEVLRQKLQDVLELASRPGSAYSYARVEDAVVRSMQLPMDTEGLKKTDEEIEASVGRATGIPSDTA